jgi:hypothetical protein
MTCWLGISLVLVGDQSGGYWSSLIWKLRQAARCDEELILFACILLFSLSVVVHLVGLLWRASYRELSLPAIGDCLRSCGTDYRRHAPSAVEATLGGLVPLTLHSGGGGWFRRAVWASIRADFETSA